MESLEIIHKITLPNIYINFVIGKNISILSINKSNRINYPKIIHVLSIFLNTTSPNVLLLSNYRKF